MNNSSLGKQLSEDNQTLQKLICSHLPQQYQLQYMNNVLNGVFLKKTTQNCITVENVTEFIILLYTMATFPAGRD